MLKYVFLLFPAFLHAQIFEKDTVSPRNLIVDQDSLHADLTFQSRLGLVEGSIEIYFHKLSIEDSIWFDAKPSVTIVGQPTFNEKKVEWERFENGVVIRPHESWTKGVVSMQFSSRPFKGVYFNGWEDPTGKAKRQIFTQGQGIDHRHWLPHVDAQNDKLKTSLSLTFQKDFEVMANGNLIQKSDLNNGMIKWTYAMDHPHSSYLIAFVIGEYNEHVFAQNPNRSGYIYKDYWDDFESTYYANDEIWNYLNHRIGVDFPWVSYRQAPVANFPHGAMENTCMTIFSDNFICNQANFEDRNYVYVNAHELAHHWFGDFVTVPSSHDFWLHEGFATYYQMEAEREVFGEEHYTYEWMKAMQRINEANDADSYPLQHSKTGSSRFYQLGALTLRALEQEVGTDVFDAAVVKYLSRNAYGLVTTDSLQVVFEETCGCDLSEFFNSYIANPHSETSYVTAQIDDETRELVYRAHVKNAFGDPLPIYKMQVRIWKSEFEYEDREMEWTNEEDAEVLRLPDSHYAAEFDPYHYYPINWEFDLPDSTNLLMALLCSPYSQARIVSDIDLNSEVFRRVSKTILAYGPLCTVDSIIVNADRQKPEKYEALIGFACFANMHKPRLELYAKHIPSSEITLDKYQSLLYVIQEDSMSTDKEATALAMRLLSVNPSRVLDVITVLKEREGGIDHDIDLLNSYLIAMVEGTEAPEGLPRLLEFAGSSYSDDIRMSAWNYLSLLKYSGKDLRDIQYKALVSRHRHLRNAAVRKTKEYLRVLDREREIANIQFALREENLEDIARVERILDLPLQD